MWPPALQRHWLHYSLSEPRSKQAGGEGRPGEEQQHAVMMQPDDGDKCCCCFFVWVEVPKNKKRGEADRGSCKGQSNLDSTSKPSFTPHWKYQKYLFLFLHPSHPSNHIVSVHIMSEQWTGLKNQEAGCSTAADGQHPLFFHLSRCQAAEMLRLRPNTSQDMARKKNTA